MLLFQIIIPYGITNLNLYRLVGQSPIIFRGKIILRTCPQQCGMVRVQTPFSRSAGLTINKDLKLKRMANHSGLSLKPAHTIIIVQNQLLTEKVLENINLVEPFFL